MKSINPFIVIAIDPHSANTVVAYDMTNGKREVAKCSPEDRFDFGVGAKLALERMFSTEEKVKPCKFKVGDIVIGNEKAERYGITRRGWIGRVVEVYDKPKNGVGCDRESRVTFKAEDFLRHGHAFDLGEDAFDLVYNYELMG